MTFALFIGCRIPQHVPEYERAARAVLRRLGVDLVDLHDLGCCGYPARHLRLDAHLLLASRNLAIAGARGLDLLTLCQCCSGNLRHAQHLLRRDTGLSAAVAGQLATEGLELPSSPGTRVRHLFDVLARDVGVETIAARVTAPQQRLRVAAHYGCHGLRPSDVVDLDSPHAPTVLERLVAATGARPVDWPRRLDCCGAPIAERNPALAARLGQAKIADPREAGASCLCTGCPWCQVQLTEQGGDEPLPTLLYAQLLGLALGLPPRVLGLEL
jgi:heterodisulfide reductase subunit B